MKVTLNLRILISAAVLTLSVFQSITAKGQVSRGLAADLKSAETPKRNGAPPAKAQPKLPPCPPAGLAPLQASPQLTGHHEVILSWKASASSGNSESKAVGYCLYRSKKQNVAKQHATCAECEQINSIAIAGTSCLDDLVEDGAIYYYVVTAINAGGKISSSSNETPAQIPLNKDRANSVSAGSYPLCRATNNLK